MHISFACSEFNNYIALIIYQPANGPQWLPAVPRGVIFLDTDLYKLTVRCAALKHFLNARDTCAFHNRIPGMNFSRVAFRWTQAIMKPCCFRLTFRSTQMWFPVALWLTSRRIAPQKKSEISIPKFTIGKSPLALSYSYNHRPSVFPFATSVSPPL